MFIINEENWEVVKKTKVIGSKNKNKVDLIDENDLIIVYAIRPLSSILGSFRVTSKTVEKKANFSGGPFPFQLKMQSIQILEKPLDIRNIVDKLSFMKRKEKWHTYLFGVKGIRELSKTDYETITNTF